MKLETICGNLYNGYKRLKQGTMLHADQLMAEQVTNYRLRKGLGVMQFL